MFANFGIYLAMKFNELKYYIYKNEPVCNGLNGLWLHSTGVETAKCESSRLWQESAESAILKQLK